MEVNLHGIRVKWENRVQVCDVNIVELGSGVMTKQCEYVIESKLLINNSSMK